MAKGSEKVIDYSSKELLTANVMNKLVHATNLLTNRLELGRGGQKMFGGERDIYDSLGYPETIQLEDYDLRYNRQDIAIRVVDAPAAATWRQKPEVGDTLDAEKPSKFEEAWNYL